MLPASTGERTQREARAGRQGGRTVEIQRLVGRSLRAAYDLEKLGERTVWLDCDVIQADGGTRTAAITGAWVALARAAKRKRRSRLPSNAVGAVSVGIVGRRGAPRPRLRRGLVGGRGHERRHERRREADRGAGDRGAERVQRAKQLDQLIDLAAGGDRADLAASSGRRQREPRTSPSAEIALRLVVAAALTRCRRARAGMARAGRGPANAHARRRRLRALHHHLRVRLRRLPLRPAERGPALRSRRGSPRRSSRASASSAPARSSARVSTSADSRPPPGSGSWPQSGWLSAPATTRAPPSSGQGSSSSASGPLRWAEGWIVAPAARGRPPRDRPASGPAARARARRPRDAARQVERIQLEEAGDEAASSASRCGCLPAWLRSRARRAAVPAWTKSLAVRWDE